MQNIKRKVSRKKIVSKMSLAFFVRLYQFTLYFLRLSVFIFGKKNEKKQKVKKKKKQVKTINDLQKK